jgi:hypothetical protein
MVDDPDSDVSNTTLYINGVFNQTNQSAISSETNIFDLNLTSGFYNWSIEVYDKNNLHNSSEVRWFYVDLIDPNVSLIFPLNDTIYSVSMLNFSYNATDNLDLILSCDVMLDGEIINSSVPSENGEYTNVSSGFLIGGSHYLNVTCYDEVNRSFTSPTHQFNISDIIPSISLVWPNNGYLDDDGNITFIFNASDNSGFINATLIINDVYDAVNETVVNGGNTSITINGLEEGFYNWSVIVYDLSSQSSEASPLNFSVDLFAPVINISAPIDNQTVTTSDVSFNFSVNDTIDSSLDCNLLINGFIVDSFSATSGALSSRIINNLTDGEKLWSVYCTDDAGHQGTSPSLNVSISEPPTIILNTDNETSFDTGDINLSYTPSDNTNLSSCSLYLNGAYNQTNSSFVSNGLENNFTLLGLTGGGYTWFVNCTDMIGLTGQSETRFFIVDTFGPNITLHYPNSDEVGTDNIFFNFTAVDDIDESFTCNLSVDSSVVNNSFTTYNGTVTNNTISGITDGFHTWFVNCTDSANNVGSSQIFNFTKSTPPLVSLVYPDDGYWFNISSFNLTYIPADDEGFLASYLFINGVYNQTNSTLITKYVDNNFSIINFSDGSYNWTVKVTDIHGLNNTVSENRTFYVDTTKPNLTLNTPMNITYDTNNITFNFTVRDNMDEDIECELYLDDEKDYENNISSGDDVLHYSLVNDGSHTWNVICLDEANNYNYSEIITFPVEAPPNVTLISPGNNVYINTNLTTFVYLPSDPIGFENCSIYIDNIFNDSVSSASIIANEQNNFTISNIPEGYHNWTVECFDAAPDYNPYNPIPWNFTMDRTPPLVMLNHPLDNLNTLRNVNFNFTANDTLDGDGNLTCNLYIDENLNLTSIIAQNNVDKLNSVLGLPLGQHDWNVSCIDDALNIGWSESLNFNVTLADLMINYSSIVFNNTNPLEDETVKINATIYNLINVTVTNITVQFYYRDPNSGGVQIGSNQTINIIDPLSKETINLDWNADLGTSQIFVIIDPPIVANGSIEEWNENNNQANNSITTGSWAFFVGDITPYSTYELADSGDSNLMEWDASNFGSGNIYAADPDSYVSWTDLQAIGKTSDDFDSTDDFADIDSLLNMTDFFDSVENLYTNSSGDVIKKVSYLIFSSIINDVPVTNSTNNTNFQTGILWDTSDSFDTEYNQIDKQDLVFFAPLNKDQVGAYGTYDYEIRIPARLREYEAVDSSEVILYTEIL